ncbi:MAG: AraC family transcriptional regulator [Bacteroidales bacterium]
MKKTNKSFSPKAITEITQLSDSDCFYISDRRKKEFTFPLHSHLEYELNFVENAEGAIRIVGDSSEPIANFDLTLITSSNLQHTWMRGGCKSQNVREITIQFSPNLFIKSFLEKNQFISIRNMFEKAENGLNFSMYAIMRVYRALDSLAKEESGFYAVMQFLSILYELSLCVDDAKILSSSSFAECIIRSDSRRINKVQEYIYKNYMKEIRLNDIADMVGMTPVSFSRFFKMRTNRTLSDYIIDIRLGFASRMLVDTTMGISEIANDCGFNNLSNFNRVFRRRKNCSPTEFRSHYKDFKKLI